MRGIRQRLLKGVCHCKRCGSRILLQGYSLKSRLSHIMDSKQLCYDCAFWQQLIDYPPDGFEVIDNVGMRILPPVDKKDKSVILGGKGKMRYFMRPNWSVFRSNDVWVVGAIPERFASLLPPTAVEITKKAFNSLKRQNRKCRARACFNRYRCFRYDIDLENDSVGAYNKVPEKWNPKNEHCGFFLDKEQVFVNLQNTTYNETKNDQTS